MIPENIIAAISENADIVEIVSDYVKLKKRGQSHIGLCPFHNEKTPSFHVNKSKGIYKCFGCGKGGDSIQFIMDIEQYSFPQSIKYLTGKLGIDYQEHELTEEEKAQKSDRESLFIINKFTAGFYQNVLKLTEEGKSKGLTYLFERGISNEIIDKFQIGYSLSNDKAAIVKNALKHDYNIELLSKSGTVVGEYPRCYDRFSGRIIFPIHNISGNVVGFGGRILQTSPNIAKYVNTPETFVYSKSNELYGLYFAKKDIIKFDKCYLVEGYTDVTSLHQINIENVVASSGTALTKQQVRLIHRFTDNLVIIYDGDSAGIKATMKGIDIVLSEGMNVKLVELPNGEDPDSFSKKNSKEYVIEYLNKNEIDFIVYKIKVYSDIIKKDPQKKANLILNIIGSIASIPNIITREMYINELSGLMNIAKDLINTQILSVLRKKDENEFNDKLNIPSIKIIDNVDSCEPIEKRILAIMLNYGNMPINYNGATVKIYEFIVNEIIEDDLFFETKEYRKVFDIYLESVEGNVEVPVHMVRQAMSGDLLGEIMTSEYVLSDIWDKINGDIDTDRDVPAIILQFKLKRIESILKNIEDKMIKTQASDELISEYLHVKKVQAALSNVLLNY